MTSIPAALLAALALCGSAWAQSATALFAPQVAQVAQARPALEVPRVPGVPRVVEGEVVDVRSRWTADGGSIISEATIRAGDGSEVSVVQLGGRVDGIGMIASHHPRPMRPGERVRAEVAVTARGDHVLRGYTPVQPIFRAHELRTARYGVNRTDRSGIPIYWASGCIHLSYDEAGTSHLPGNAEFDILDQATAEWEDETSVCSGLTFSSTFVAAAQPGRNQLNTVMWREDEWCRPATDTTPQVCHDPGNIAVTQVFFIDEPTSPRDGEIVEADIEFNGVHFAFADSGVSAGPAGKTLVDLRSTATHELGHLLGLTHNCAQLTEEPATDHQGNPVPDCTLSDLGPEIIDATMYYAQDENETKKATLETEDVLGACAALNGIECNRVVRGAAVGCSAAPGRSGDGAFLAAMLLLAWTRRRWLCHREASSRISTGGGA